MVTIANTYIYDQVGRKLKSWEQITNGNNTPTTKTLLSLTGYNEIGQLTTKKLQSTDSLNFLQAITYGYNERGWLLTSSAPLFAMQLYYNTGTSMAWNGNIMYQYWGTPGNLANHYTYQYDKLNRLTFGNSTFGNGERSIAYDQMGNITALSRYTTNTLTDQLTYSYSSTNQVQSIVDASGSNTGLVNGITNYSYDGNGNMLSNTNTVNTTQNKSFTYNLLNLPIVATVSTGTATYAYDATGNKLRKVDVISGVTTATDYISGIQYGTTGGTTSLSFIQTEEGKAVVNGTGYDYTYYLGDNLGNTRITFGTKTGAAVVYQSDDYYPFGMEINNSVLSPKNEYLYNKKELQEETQEYDYGARFYDPVIARWTTIDKLAEEDRRWSPYSYGHNNPIRFIDVDGLFVKPGDLFTSVDAAAIDFGKFYNGKSIINNEEYNSTLYSVVKDGKTYYSYTPSSENNGPLSSVIPPTPEGTTNEGNAHTHDAAQPGVPAKESPDQFSDYDITTTDSKKDNPTQKPSYVATPDGSLLKHDPKTGETKTLATDIPSDPNEGKNRKNDISPYTGRSESADLKKAQQDLNKPIQAKRDAIPIQPTPPPQPKKH